MNKNRKNLVSISLLEKNLEAVVQRSSAKIFRIHKETPDLESLFNVACKKI